QAHHWQRYLYRHPLSDLWRGWQGVADGSLHDAVLIKYQAGKRGKEMELSGEGMQRIADRLRSIPSHFKRIRWFGVFSDGQRAETMASLGLEADNVEAEDDGDGEKWVQEGGPHRFVRYTPEGVVLREVLHDERGDVLQDEFMSDDGFPMWRERLGPEFLVPDKLIDYRPSKVSIGKHKRWREPGGQ
ncbi:unnamed protein product, partial [marine sediment metagenome]